jgi:bifunctional non-homologous end joining protein LigD
MPDSILLPEEVDRALAGLPFRLTRPQKLLFPGAGMTKLDLVRYYLTVSPALLPHLRDRPLTLKQYPDGVGGRSFFRKHAPTYRPSWISTYRARAGSTGRDVEYIVANDEATLAWVANQAAIELHLWLSCTTHVERPDWMVFDLDPGTDSGMEDVRRAALTLREVLGEDGLEAVPKLSGKRGIHLLVPLVPDATFESVRLYAEETARRAEARWPERITAGYTRRDERRACVLVDYALNASGRTVVAPYSVRATPQATVSTPLTWVELEAGTPDPRAFTAVTLPERLLQRGDLLTQLPEQRLPG